MQTSSNLWFSLLPRSFGQVSMCAFESIVPFVSYPVNGRALSDNYDDLLEIAFEGHCF